MPIHNDMSLWDLSERKYQGSVCLLDCPVGHGGFRCIPGFHKLEKIRNYRQDCLSGKYGILNMYPSEGVFNLFLDEDYIKEHCLEIPMEKGDFIVWNSRLPHSNAVNRSPNWRMQCFIQYLPTNSIEGYAETVLLSTSLIVD